MTDLDIETAQLIIQLAREDIYGLDGSPDDALVSDLEFALAAQEQEFMHHWTGYGDAQFTPGDRPGPSGGRGGVGLVHPNVNQTSATASMITVAPPSAPAPQVVASASSWSSSPPTAARATTGGVPAHHSSSTLPESDEIGYRGLYLETGPSRLPAPSTHEAALRQLLNAARPSVIVYEPPAEEQPPVEWTVAQGHQTVRGSDWGAELYEPPADVDEDPQTASDPDWGTESEVLSEPPAEEQPVIEWTVETGADLEWGVPEEYRPASVAGSEPADDLYRVVGDYSPVPPASPAHSDQYYYEVFNEWPIGAAVERPMSRASSPSTSENEASSHNPLYRTEDLEEDASVKMLNLLREMLGVQEVAPRVEPSVECAFCKEQCPTSSALGTPCSHYVCRSCVTRNVEVCVRDETTYPPKCCGRGLPSQDLVKLLKDSSLRARYESKCIEYGTAIRDRVYCCKCTDFLGPKETRGASSSSTVVASFTTLPRSVVHGALYCFRCLVTTCTACGQAAHPSRLCQDTPADLAFKKLSTDQGWQKCPNCEAVVDLEVGCYHMKCRCSTEFCYLCATKWKGCSCPNAEEHRLVLP